MAKQLGQEPAFPCNSPDGIETYKGMSKRFYAACWAIQGLLSDLTSTVRMSKSFLVEEAFEIADKLLERENKQKGVKNE